MDISLLEIKNCKCLMVEREWLDGMIPTARLLMNGELRTKESEKRLQAHALMSEGGSFLMKEKGAGGYGSMEMNEDAYLNVIFMEGMITRNGGACTYGSKQIRNLMMQASDDENCMGHVWVLDTPGGLSLAVPDLMMAVDYAHSKGLAVEGIIDGVCASLGIYAGQMCDKLYYTSPSNLIGSVGVYGIYDTMKNGDIDPETGERHFEIYDPESFDKNAGYRELAEKGKSDIIVADLKKHGKEFRDFVKSRRPNADDSMLHGKLFECKEVDGILVDGQRTLQEVLQEVAERYYETQKQQTLSTQLNNINMKEQFPAVFALLGVEEMQMQEGGAFVNTELLATLNANIEAAQKEAADAKALAESLTAEKNELTAKVEELTAQAETKEAEHAKAIEDLNAAHTAAIEEKDNAITALEQEKADLQGKIDENATSAEALTTELNGAKESLTKAEGIIAERDQQISDLNAQIAELQNNPGEGAQAGAAPQDNGSGAEAQGVAISSQYVYDSTKSYEENMKAKKEWEAAHK